MDTDDLTRDGLNTSSSIASDLTDVIMTGLDEVRIWRAYRSSFAPFLFNWLATQKDSETTMNIVSRGSPIGIPAPRERSMSDLPLNRILSIMRRQEREFREKAADHKLH